LEIEPLGLADILLSKSVKLALPCPPPEFLAVASKSTEEGNHKRRLAISFLSFSYGLG